MTAGRMRGRFAPSPSGRMHLGNAFSSLMAWLAARSAGGEMVLRIEDLDPRNQRADWAELVIEDLQWLGLDWDEGPIYQRNHGAAYEGAIERLAAERLIYPCFCTRRELHAAEAPHASDGTYVYPGTCRNLSPEEVADRSRERNPGLRLRVPDPGDPAAMVSFVDEVYGPQVQDLATDCGDILVRRSDDIVAYQLAVVVNDGDEGITQVVRGRDLLGSTERQIYIQELLGLQRPSYIHVPLLVAPDGRRLSKRDGDLDLGALRERYDSPEPIIGALAAAVGIAELGEAASAEDLVDRFSLDILRAHRDDIVVDGNFLP